MNKICNDNFKELKINHTSSISAKNANNDQTTKDNSKDSYISQIYLKYKKMISLISETKQITKYNTNNSHYLNLNKNDIIKLNNVRFNLLINNKKSEEFRITIKNINVLEITYKKNE